MKPKYIRWTIALVFLLLIIVDVLDRDGLKIFTTVFLAIDVVAFSFGYESTRQRTWFTIAYVSLALAGAGFIYRLLIFVS